MNRWTPHVTVACVIARDGRYLMVEERDKITGKLVFNQPAGHLEADESLAQAALRETLEETGWHIRLTHVLGIALHQHATNGVTYYRTTFVAQALAQQQDAVLDPDIHAVHWLDYEAILAHSDRMRSPLALTVIERHRQGNFYPLDLILTP